MQNLLVIEQSSTLSNLLTRTLRAGGYESITVIQDFAEAARLIDSSKATAQAFSVVIVGMPARIGESVRDLLKFMHSDRANRIPLLIVIHDKYPVLDRWAETRGATQVVPWQRFSRIPSLLEQLLPEDSTELPSSATPTDSPNHAKVRVLFVDDSQSARYAYRQLLQSRGYPVEVAGSVAEAKQVAANGQFDLIILDYYLPDGTGAELCRMLKQAPNTQSATMAVITGSYREQIIKACLEAGAVECMFKNEAKELFITRVNSIANSIETQRSVESERRRLNGILGSVGDGVYGVDQDGQLTFINTTGAEILGYDAPDQLVGKNVKTLLHYRNHDLDSDPVLDQAYASGDSINGHESVFCHKNSKPLPVECTVFPLSIENNREGSVVVFRDISERKTVEQLRWEVAHDSLTGLANRRHFSQHLEKELDRLRDAGGYDAVLNIDLDRFGDMVEAGGEAEGDRILVDVATKLGAQLRDNDMLARLEADKFVLLLSGIQLPNLFTIADAYRSIIGETKYDYYGIERPVAASVGVLIISRLTPSAEYALEHARVACEAAKKKGRNQTQIYIAEEDTRTARELESGWEDRFKDAIRHNRFVFLVQPIVLSLNVSSSWDHRDATRPPPVDSDGELLFEVLLRMLSSDDQWISPSVFVPLAERVNMVQEIDIWVIRNALARLAGLEHSRYKISLTVNISNVTLQDPESLRLISDVIHASEVDPTRLVFEVTETAEIGDLHHARRFMQCLKKIGCRFALDDFGTGFSSFSHLKHLPVDFIKIDGQFVQAMTNDEVDRTMVYSITSMAHSLGLRTIAEHVDSPDTLVAAQQAGVDFVQGHFFGTPCELDTLDFKNLFGVEQS